MQTLVVVEAPALRQETQLQPQPQPTTPLDIAKITNLDVLTAEWQPRYDAAKLAYVKFEASVNNAKSRAADYIAQQQALTQQIRDPDNQAKARQEDAWEISLYRQWEAKADSALHTAAQIGIQLDDMDAYLRIQVAMRRKGKLPSVYRALAVATGIGRYRWHET